MTTVSPEVIEKWRSEYISLSNLPEVMLGLNEDGEFICADAEIGWQGFLNGRQSAVIELPEKVSVGFGTNRAFTYILVDELIEKLEAQGYQVNFNQPTQG